MTEELPEGWARLDPERPGVLHFFRAGERYSPCHRYRLTPSRVQADPPHTFKCMKCLVSLKRAERKKKGA